MASDTHLPAAGPTRVVVATTVLLSFISFWRAAAIVLGDLGSTAFYVGGIAEQAIGQGRAVVRARRDALRLGRAGDLHRELGHVRPRRRLPRRQGGHGRHDGQAVGLGAAVRLRADRAHQRRLGRPLYRRAAHRHPRALRHRPAHPQGPVRGRARHGHHRVLLAAQHARSPRIEQRRAPHHADYDRHGRDPARVVALHAPGPRRARCRRLPPSITSISPSTPSDG